MLEKLAFWGRIILAFMQKLLGWEISSLILGKEFMQLRGCHTKGAKLLDEGLHIKS
jgi:hypothetical protein